MSGKKALDLVEVMRRGDEVVVKAYDYTAVGMPDGYVLDATFAGAWVVQMLKRRRAGGQWRWRGRAVLGDKDFARSFARGANELRRQTVEQARERVGTRVGRDYDRELQDRLLKKCIGQNQPWKPA